MGKAPNGEGLSEQFRVDFDLSDPTQAKAWEVAQRKALPHGTRKHLIIAFLYAIYEYEQRTGREVTADMISGQTIGDALSGRFRSAEQPIVDEEPESFDSAEIFIASADKLSSSETANRFMANTGNLFGS